MHCRRSVKSRTMECISWCTNRLINWFHADGWLADYFTTSLRIVECRQLIPTSAVFSMATIGRAPATTRRRYQWHINVWTLLVRSCKWWLIADQKKLPPLKRRVYVTARQIDPHQQTPTSVCRYLLPIGRRNLGTANMSAPPFFLALLAESQQTLCHGFRRLSVGFFLVYAIKSTFSVGFSWNLKLCLPYQWLQPCRFWKKSEYQ